MPYISEEKRKKYDNISNALVNCLREERENDVGGCLNYIIYNEFQRKLVPLGTR